MKERMNECMNCLINIIASLHINCTVQLLLHWQALLYLSEILHHVLPSILSIQFIAMQYYTLVSSPVFK